MPKKDKKFVDSRDTALRLAGLVSEYVEQKAEAKKRKDTPKTAVSKTSNQIQCPRHSESARMKRAKEVVLAKEAQVKKQKANARKQASKPTSNATAPQDKDRVKRKRVSFV